MEKNRIIQASASLWHYPLPGVTGGSGITAVDVIVVDLEAADGVTGVVRAVWVRPSDEDPEAGAGEGFDEIIVRDIVLGPDLTIAASGIFSTTPYPQAGEEVILVARVHNDGTDSVSQSILVGFYLDGEPPIGTPIGTAWETHVMAVGRAYAVPERSVFSHLWSLVSLG